MRRELFIALLLVACGGSTSDTSDTSDEIGAASSGGTGAGGTGAGGTEVPAPSGYGTRLESGLTTGGQPSEADLRALAARGVRVVISLRAPGEPGFAEEQAAVEQLGGQFVSIPVQGPEDLTPENAAAVHEAIQIAGPESTVLHCGSGNRVGALVSLVALHHENASQEQAIAAGDAAGLSRWEEAVDAYVHAACGGSEAPSGCE